jgi:signal transduction histidine kinase
LTVEGRVRPLPPTLEVSAYRIAQEALTNTLKHAGPAAARLRLVYGESDLELEVSDNGRGVAADQHRSGYGLVGMRERVRLFGGELEAGPGAGGGFCVRARLSLEARAEPVSSGAGRPEHGHRCRRVRGAVS